jgi:regulator of replication initiation timing
MKWNEGQRPFVEKAATDTREYLKSLLDENQRLSRVVAELEITLSQRQAMETLLEERIAAVEEESRRFSERYVEVEQQNTSLADLYVAGYQLNGTLDRSRVVQSIQEIIINLVGCEELGVWEVDEEIGALVLAASFGIEAGRWASVPLHAGLIGTVAATGERYVEGESDEPIAAHEAGLTACIPLKLDDRVVGVIATFRLLQQKPGLEPLDYELFDLLASHAATALYCTRPLARAAAADPEWKVLHARLCGD